MSFYKKHIFVCTNQKNNDKPCCANHNATEMVAYAREKLAALGVKKECRVRVSSSGCMGRCSLGPVIVHYPEGRWYSYAAKSDIDQILNAIINDGVSQEHLLPDE